MRNISKRTTALAVLIVSLCIFTLSLTYSNRAQAAGAAVITGEQRQWHKISLTWTGPNTSETSNPNPFLDYRLDVTFTKGNQSYTVPGYYCADGNAAETSATSGNKWCAHFAPDSTGTWNYSVAFKSGSKVAINGGGSSAGFFDGDTGSFNVSASNKSGRDFRAKGRAAYVGEHYLQHLGTGEYLVKAGADAPENAFCYNDFDQTRTIKNWNPHQQDYQASDASAYTWQGGKGSELLGAVAYLHNKGVNAMSFLTFSLDGDSDCATPHLSTGGNPSSWSGVHHTRFDVSKMGQWERIMEYADKKGVFLHFKTFETENDQIMNWEDRRLYYRMLVAHYSHHLALNWNISEEISIDNSLIKDSINYVQGVDAYDHLVVFHTYPGQKDRYNQFTGNQSNLTGASLQISPIAPTHDEVKTWVNASNNAGKKWVVANDEQGPAGVGVDNDPDARTAVRRDVTWGTFMAGGAGVEFYYGYQTSCTDLNCQDHRTRDQKYTDAAHALNFFNTGNNGSQLPFWQMSNNDGALSGEAGNDGWVLQQPGQVYVVYLADGNPSGTLNVTNKTYTQRWYNPRTGQFEGSTKTVSGGSIALGSPPNSVNSDWVALLTSGGGPSPTPTPAPGQGPFGGTPWSIPGQIQAEDYDTGGQGVAYNDTTNGNTGGAYRSNDVDLQATSDNGGGYNVGWIAGGEWLEYTTNVSPGTYNIQLRVAAQPSNPGDIVVKLGNQTLGTIDVTNTGGWQSWQTKTLSNQNITVSGQQVLRLEMAGGNFNINWINFVSTSPNPTNTPPPPTATAPAPTATPSGNPQSQTFTPSHDAYLQGSTRFNNNLLRVENGNRVAYLQFDVTGLSGTVTDVKLNLKVDSDAGNGTMRFYEGTSNNWTESNLSNSNKPGKGAQVAVRTGSWNVGTTYTLDVDSLLSGNGTVTVVIEMDSGGNDAAFSSKEGSFAPQLVVTYSP